MDKRVEGILLNVLYPPAGVSRIVILRDISVSDLITKLNHASFMYHHQLDLCSQRLQNIQAARAPLNEPPIQPHPLSIARPLLHRFIFETLRLPVDGSLQPGTGFNKEVEACIARGTLSNENIIGVIFML